MHYQNPEYYGVKKGIPSERLEKHMQGPLLLCTLCLNFESLLLLFSLDYFDLNIRNMRSEGQ